MTSQGLLIVAMFSFVGCVPEITDDLATVGEPRLLAIAASPAEAAPASSVTLTALVATPDGAHAGSVDWQLCIERKPLTELGAVAPACLDVGAKASIAVNLGRGESVASDVPRESCSLFGPNPPPPKAGETTGGRPVDPDPTGGYYQPALAFLRGQEPTLGAIRLLCGIPGLSPEQRVDFGNRYRVNENPHIDALRLKDGTVIAPADKGSPIARRRGSASVLSAEWATCPRKSMCGDGICGAREDTASCADDCPQGVSKGCTGAETYAWFDTEANAVVDRREGIVVTWYSTSGEFSDRRTGVSETDRDVAHVETTWTAPSSRGTAIVWAVIRDDRGGASWETYRVDVQ